MEEQPTKRQRLIEIVTHYKENNAFQSIETFKTFVINLHRQRYTSDNLYRLRVELNRLKTAHLLELTTLKAKVVHHRSIIDDPNCEEGTLVKSTEKLLTNSSNAIENMKSHVLSKDDNNELKSSRRLDWLDKKQEEKRKAEEYLNSSKVYISWLNAWQEYQKKQEEYGITELKQKIKHHGVLTGQGFSERGKTFERKCFDSTKAEIYCKYGENLNEFIYIPLRGATLGIAKGELDYLVVAIKWESFKGILRKQDQNTSIQNAMDIIWRNDHCFSEMERRKYNSKFRNEYLFCTVVFISEAKRSFDDLAYAFTTKQEMIRFFKNDIEKSSEYVNKYFPAGSFTGIFIKTSNADNPLLNRINLMFTVESFDLFNKQLEAKDTTKTDGDYVFPLYFQFILPSQPPRGIPSDAFNKFLYQLSKRSTLIDNYTGGESSSEEHEREWNDLYQDFQNIAHPRSLLIDNSCELIDIYLKHSWESQLMIIDV